MHLRIQDITDTEPDTSGALRSVRLRRVAGTHEQQISLWDEPQEPGAGAQWYEVTTHDKGVAVAEQPAVASIVHFDGPLTPELYEAGERAHRERIAPAFADHPGLVETLVGWQPERRRLVVVVLTTSMAALEEGRRVISTQELLPGEDPALLPGPDRTELCQVVPQGSPVR